MTMQPGPEPRRPTVITDIDVPFGRMVVFFFKAGLAAIPAAIAVWMVMIAIFAIVGLVFGGGPMAWRGMWMMH